MAARQGFEPRYAAPEAAVLPLNEGATRKNGLVLRPCWRGLGRAPASKNQLVHHKGDSTARSNLSFRDSILAAWNSVPTGKTRHGRGHAFTGGKSP